jgi:uncharacterized protein (DUF305 family)
MTQPSLTPTFCRLAIIAAAALWQPASFAQPAPAHDMGKMAAPATGKASMDMKDSMSEMNSQMAAMVMTGDPDIDFAAMMRIHHLGAIDMAMTELKTGRNPQMRKLAEDIIAAQKHEIVVLEKYLAKKGHPVDKSKK